MLIEGAGVVAHRSTPAPFFIKSYTKTIVMKRLLPLTLCIVLFAACNTNPPEPKGTTITFTETEELFPNPERGLYAQVYYSSEDVEKHASAVTIEQNRETAAYLALYLHSYYLTDYMESDIPQAFLDRLETNMNALREGGAKAVLRFSYKSSKIGRAHV